MDVPSTNDASQFRRSRPLRRKAEPKKPVVRGPGALEKSRIVGEFLMGPVIFGLSPKEDRLTTECSATVPGRAFTCMWNPTRLSGSRFGGPVLAHLIFWSSVTSCMGVEGKFARP